MSSYQHRIDAIKTLVAGSVIAQYPIHASIQQELDDAYAVVRIRKTQRKRLLQLLHSTRALDSSLKTFATHHGCLGSAKSLGKYLLALTNHTLATLGKLSETERRHYQKEIIRRRNHYIHEAGTFPTNAKEILDLLAEMQACLARVLSL